MITILSPDQQFKYEPIDESVKQELTKRESDKNRMIGRVPFVRLTCLQKVTYTNEEKLYKQNNYKETSETQQRENKQVDCFVLELGGSFDETYGTRQVIGKDLKNNRKIYVPNPRKVPPPRLTSFTAQNGESAGFYTTANLQLTVNSKEQLEFLTPFLLHPGNTVFVEFGYSDKNTTMNEELFSYSDKKEFVSSLKIKNTEENDDRVTLEEFYNKQQQKVLDNEGNFEFVVGVIHNFDFKLNSDFGFDVNIDLWSISKTRMGAADKNSKKESTIIDREQLLREEIARLEYRKQYINKDTLTSNINLYNSKDPFGSNQKPPIGSGVLKQDLRQDVINLNTINGKKKYVRLGNFINYLSAEFSEQTIDRQALRLNPFIVSNNDDVIWFYRNTINYKNLEKTIFNEFIFTESSVKQLLKNTIKLSEELIDPLSIQINSRPSGDGLNRRPIYYVDFETIRPHFIDEGGFDDSGDLFNIYIETEKLIRTYVGNRFNINDTLRKLMSDIVESSSDVWQIKSVSTEDKVVMTSFSGRKIEEKDRPNTYTFKFNQKQSVTNEISFDLKLEGIIGDQIYFESINQTDSNTNSTKLNLLLFEKHENGIEIWDYRNKELEEEAKKNNIKYPLGESSTNKESTLSSNEITNRYFANKLEKNIPLYSIKNKTVEQLKSELLGKFVPKDDNNDGIVDENGSVVSQVLEFLNNEVDEITTIQSKYEPYLTALELAKIVPTSNDGDEEETESTPTLGGVNPLLESSVDIVMPGLGGFRPLTFFNTDGLPDVYDKRGDFCIMNVAHSLTPTSWTTSINSRFRIRDKQ